MWRKARPYHFLSNIEPYARVTDARRDFHCAHDGFGRTASSDFQSTLTLEQIGCDDMSLAVVSVVDVFPCLSCAV
jgi:hypothetical protein